MSCQYFFLLFFPILLSTIFFIKQKPKTRNLPPGPNKLPIIGNLHQLGNAPHLAFQHLAKQFGPLMFLKLGSVPTLVISSAEIAREVFKNHDIVFSGRPKLYASNRFSYNGASMATAPHGEYWRELRKIAILELLSIKRVQSFSKIRDQEIASMIESIAKSRGIVDVSDLTIRMSNNVQRMVMFSDQGEGKKIGERSLGEIFGEKQNLLGGFCLSDFFPWMEWWNKFNGLQDRVERVFKELDEYFDKMLEEHSNPKRENNEHEDLIDVLLMIQKDPNQALKLTRDHIKGALTDMFTAGTDATSSVLVWTMTELIKHPANMQKVQNEVREIGNGKPKIEESDLSKLPYMKLVIKEGLRLHPPLPLLVPRETTQKCTIQNFEIPSGTRVFINVKSIATDPNHWENANDFRPERFLNSSIDFRGQHYEYLPFGGGRRSCPGINFGLPLVDLALANLLYRFDWSLPQGMGIEDIDMDDVFGLAVLKKVPLRLVASAAKY